MVEDMWIIALFLIVVDWFSPIIASKAFCIVLENCSVRFIVKFFDSPNFYMADMTPVLEIAHLVSSFFQELKTSDRIRNSLRCVHETLWTFIICLWIYSLIAKTHCSSCMHIETWYFSIFQNILGTTKQKTENRNSEVAIKSSSGKRVFW